MSKVLKAARKSLSATWEHFQACAVVCQLRGCHRDAGILRDTARGRHWCNPMAADGFQLKDGRRADPLIPAFLLRPLSTGQKETQTRRRRFVGTLNRNFLVGIDRRFPKHCGNQNDNPANGSERQDGMEEKEQCGSERCSRSDVELSVHRGLTCDFRISWKKPINQKNNSP